MKTVFFALILLSAGNAISAEWGEYFHSSAGTKSYIDKSSIVSLPGGKVRAWEKFVSPNGNGNVALVEVDCKQRMYTIRQMEPLDKNDADVWKILETAMKGWREPEQFWDYINTDDSQEAMYNAWCKK